MPRERAHVYRRRRLVAAGVAGAAVIGGLLAVRGGGGDGGETAPVPDPYADVPLDRLIGQRLMVRMTDQATPQLLDWARAGTIGGVILFPAPEAPPAELAGQIRRLQRAAVRGGNPPLLIAIDQEGGAVKRLPAAPPAESPAELGADGDPAAALTEGEETGAFLAGLGINLDLAPVLDVPAPGSFIVGRAFGHEPGAVAETGVAFAEGLQRSGLAATAKHFPGLGLASVNTDVGPSLVGASRSRLRAGMAPFEAAIAAGIELVMVSNATYAGLDPDAPAVLSPRIVEEELRARLGFDGVIITDDLQAGSISASLAPPGAAVEAAKAGADVLLFALGADPEPIAHALRRAAERGALDRASLEASYARITGLKDRVASG